jgi:hypothetical protein
MTLPFRGPRLALPLLATALLVAAACGGPPSPPATSGGPSTAAPVEAGIVHVHALGLDSGDGTLYVATHTGLFRLTSAGTAERIGDRHMDVMGFTVAAPGLLLGSGHPDMRDYREGRLPALLGLVESRDGGRSWQPLSLLGQADFHGLRAAHGQIYGWDATSGTFMVSGDGRTWDRRSRLVLRDFVVSPSGADLIVAAGEPRLVRSADGGRTWTPLQAPRLVVLAWDGGTLWGAAETGALMRSHDAGDTWEQAGSLGGVPSALTAAGSTLYAAIHPGTIMRSDDGGATWQTLYRDPTGR